jgi:hypothetical protein
MLVLLVMRTVLFLLLAVPLFGQSEICRFRAGDAENPFGRWLASQELTCVAASSATAVPTGLWNVFARGAGGLSAPVLVKGGMTPDAASLQAGPAATLVLQLPEGRGGVVYVPRRGIAFPASARMLVPAAEGLWLLIVDKAHAVESIVTIAALDEKSERTVDARIGALPPSILGWVNVAESDREALRNATDAASPQVHLSATGSARDADPLPPLAALPGAFFLVRGATAGEAELSLGGRGWLTQRGRVKVESRVVTSVRAPLFARPAASLIVNWSAADDLRELDRSLGSCDPSKDRPARFEISVSACPPPNRAGDAVDPASCRMVRQETFGPEVPFGSFAVDDLVPGTYRVELRFGKLPPTSITGTAVALQQRPVRLQAAFMTLYGNLTRGGEPLRRDATLQFPNGGVGFGAREKGEYFAVVQNEMLEPDMKVDITECGRPPVLVLTDDFGRRTMRLNLDIPDNKLTINVSDTFTGMALHEATLRYVVMSKLMPQRPLVTLEAIPERELRLLVTHAGYQKYPVEPFTMEKSESKHLDVKMMPLRGSSGRIVSARPFESGVVVWQSAGGVETERADLAPDGTFVYTNSHEAGEIMAVASLSHPLWVLRAPAAVRAQMMEVRFPDTAWVRTFDVGLKGVPSGAATYIGIVIGGLLVPQGALRTHQDLRELPSLVRVGTSQTYRDIAETGPIEILRGPTVNEVPSRGRSIDPLMLPMAANAPRQRLLPGMTVVVFE